jgi:signal transduction histidine kinase
VLPTILEDEIDGISETFRIRLAAVGLHVVQLIHELAAPLTVIRMRLELLQQHRVLYSGEAVSGVVAEIRSEADRMERLFSRVRAVLAGDQRADQVMRPAPADLNSVVQEAVSTVKRWHDGIVTFDEAYADLPLLQLDRDWLCQAVMNLVKNACEAMEGAGTVSIRTSTRRNPPAAELTVQDTGYGIPAEAIGSLFLPFNTSKEHGLGLGLTISRAIVTAHGGSIDVDSTPGRGTTFRVTLPFQSNGNP